MNQTKCKYEQNHKNYVVCTRDNSRRTKNCPCHNFEPRFWSKVWNKIKNWFRENW